jgi:hypothetical protein
LTLGLFASSIKRFSFYTLFQKVLPHLKQAVAATDYRKDLIYARNKQVAQCVRIGEAVSPGYRNYRKSIDQEREKGCA